MARGDGIHRTSARNARMKDTDIDNAQAHNEREKSSYVNQDIVPERTPYNVHFKTPTAGYKEMFEQMRSDGVISTRANMIQRAKELVEELSDADITAAVKDLTAPKKKQKISYDQVDMAQMSLFDTVKDDDIIEEIKGLDMGNMTPIEAMNTLYNLQNKIKNRW